MVLTQIQAFKGFFTTILTREGRSASISTPLEQVIWVNQTVPFGF